MVFLVRYDNYELVFMHNGSAIKFNSSSLQEIKDVNQILINISFDINRLKRRRRYKLNGRYYDLRYNNGVLKVLDSYERRENRYFMADNLDINVVDNGKLNSKLIFEDSDDFLERNDNHEVVLSSGNDADSPSQIPMANEIRSDLRYFKKNAMRPDEEFGASDNEINFHSRGEDGQIISKDFYKDESPIFKENDSQNGPDIESDNLYNNVQRKEAPRNYIEDSRNIFNEYPRYINKPSLNSRSVFIKDFNDEDAAIRAKIIKLASYVDASIHRSLVLNDLNTSIKTPKTISLETGLRPNFVSKVLKDFKDKDIAVCINEEVRKGKLYELTPTGLKIFDYLQSL